MDNVANFFRITGVKLELGSVATPIQFVPFDEDLRQCMRYFQKSFPYATAPAQNAGTAGAATMLSPATTTSSIGIYQVLPVLMRPMVNPSETSYNPSAANAQARNATDAADGSITVATADERQIVISWSPNAANTIGDVWAINWAIDSEL
jgi:hypothetical protein